jgi:hypothetical protein
MPKLPPPEQWVMTRLNEMQAAELIEQHIDYVDDEGQSVHLAMPFVRHYMQRFDGVLPTVVAIATQPIVLADGVVLAKEHGLDRERGIAFRIQKEIMACVPRREQCDETAIVKALRFLTDEWLIDVQTDFIGKCIIVAAALTIIERSLLDQRPVFFVTAGRRGGGKTTTLTMLIIAVTGVWPAAAAWSGGVEERRKALLSYFMDGLSYILWDNIPRGFQISCPHIERSCTSAYYADRKLGVSEAVLTAAATIHLFTGNNIGARGDLASRALGIRLEVDRPDPENREFNHPDPIGWTEAHRAEILHAFYTILLGNPTLDKPRNATMKTRFKMWWRLVGSAIEHAASLAGETVDFKDLFRKQDDEDEDAASLVDVLEILEKRIATKVFAANEVAKIANDMTADSEVLREILFPDLRENATVSSKSMGRRLKKHIDEPVRSGERVLILRRHRDDAAASKDSFQYYIDGAAEKVTAPECDYLAKEGGIGKSKDPRDNRRRRG